MAKQQRVQTNTWTKNNSVAVIRGGAAYFDKIVAMAATATYSLHLQTYIYDADETGQLVADALKSAAARGVLVYVLLDGYASQNLPDVFIRELEEAGVHFSFFEPVWRSKYFYMGRRLHHKVVVADGAMALVAGLNISNRYNSIAPTGPWLDWALYTEGEAAAMLNEVCVRIWDRSVLRKNCLATDNPALEPLPVPDCPVRVIRNDWVFKKTDITRSYANLFREAKHEVLLMTSYFWPQRKLMRRISEASKRGVKIKIILTQFADVPLAKYAERYLYRWLFRHQIEVYEYKRNVLHGKAAVADGWVLTAGSYNVNNISALASVELNLEVQDATVGAEMTQQMNQIIAEDCDQITPDLFGKQAGPARKFFYYLAYKLIHIMFFLFTFYFNQRNNSETNQSPNTGA